MKFTSTLFSVALLVLCSTSVEAKDASGITTSSSSPARGYCYSVTDPTLAGSCPMHVSQSQGNQPTRLVSGEDVVVSLRFDWLQLNNTNINGTGAYLGTAGQLAYSKELNNTLNTTSQWVNQTSLSWFFPKTDVFSQLTLNGSTTLSYLDARKSSWDQVWLSFQLIRNGTAYSTPPKRWFTYSTDAFASSNSGSVQGEMDGLYVIPYRGVVITLWNGYVQSVDWEPVPEKALSFCTVPTDGLDLCPIRWDNTASGSSATRDIKVYLMWSGTDANGRVLNSVERSMYNLQYFI